MPECNLISFLSDSVPHSLIVLFLYGSSWSVVGEEALPPNGSVYQLFALYVTSVILGHLATLVRLPDLLGMLIAGFVLSNFFSFDFDPDISSATRNLALTVILLRAGLGLDPGALTRLKGICFRLSFAPCLLEAVTIGLIGHFVLVMPFQWSFLLGFVVAAVSPGVVVAQMIALQEKNCGTAKGIPTLVIAAATLDNVLTITGFSVVLGFVFSQGGSLAWRIVKGPVEVIGGLLIGALIGYLLRFLENSNSTQHPTLVLVSGTFVIFTSKTMDFGSAGPLAALTIAFVSGLKWQENNSKAFVSSQLKSTWLIVQPFLFGLTGATVKISSVSPSLLGNAMLIISFGLVIRCLVAMASTHGSDLNFKEKLFIAMAWLPKATVQAAFAPVALDMALQLEDVVAIKFATELLTVAILAILICAPLGATAIAIGGPKLLKCSDGLLSADESISCSKEPSEVLVNVLQD